MHAVSISLGMPEIRDAGGHLSGGNDVRDEKSDDEDIVFLSERRLEDLSVEELQERLETTSSRLRAAKYHACRYAFYHVRLCTTSMTHQTQPRLRQVKNILAFNAAKMRAGKDIKDYNAAKTDVARAAARVKALKIKEPPSLPPFRYAMDTDETQVVSCMDNEAQASDTGATPSKGLPAQASDAGSTPNKGLPADFPAVPAGYVTRREQFALRNNHDEEGDDEGKPSHAGGSRVARAAKEKAEAKAEAKATAKATASCKSRLSSRSSPSTKRKHSPRSLTRSTTTPASMEASPGSMDNVAEASGEALPKAKKESLQSPRQLASPALRATLEPVLAARRRPRQALNPKPRQAAKSKPAQAPKPKPAHPKPKPAHPKQKPAQAPKRKPAASPDPAQPPLQLHLRTLQRFQSPSVPGPETEILNFQPPILDMDHVEATLRNIFHECVRKEPHEPEIGRFPTDSPVRLCPYNTWASRPGLLTVTELVSFSSPTTCQCALPVPVHAACCFWRSRLHLDLHKCYDVYRY